MLPMLPLFTIIGFTGHRRIEDSTLIVGAIRTAMEEFENNRGPLCAISSAASGADTLFLEAIAQQQLPYFLILPFDQQRFRQDFNEEDWSRAAAHFADALDIEVVHDAEEDNDAYLECGLRTVDRCDVLIAVWNGEAAAGKGGTGDVVEYARALNKPLIWIDAATGEIRREWMEKLSVHNARRAAEIPSPEKSPLQVVRNQYEHFNDVAMQHAPQTRQLIWRIIRLHLIAAAIGITGYVLGVGHHLQQLFLTLELAALSYSLYLVAQQHHTHRQWTEARLGAEICRSFIVLWPLRRRGAALPKPPFDDRRDLIRSLEMAWYMACDQELPLEAARDRYVADRVQDQMRYFSERYRVAGDRADKYRRLAICATIAAIACGCAALLISALGDHGWTYKLFKLPAMLLPLVPPALLSLVVAHDLGRRAQRFHEISIKLQQFEQRLQAVRTWPGLWKEVQACETLLLQDNAEWYSLARFAGHSH